MITRNTFFACFLGVLRAIHSGHFPNDYSETHRVHSLHFLLVVWCIPRRTRVYIRLLWKVSRVNVVWLNWCFFYYDYYYSFFLGGSFTFKMFSLLFYFHSSPSFLVDFFSFFFNPDHSKLSNYPYYRKPDAETELSSMKRNARTRSAKEITDSRRLHYYY